MLRCTVRVAEASPDDTMEVRLYSAVIAHDVVVHRDRRASATTRRAGGFDAGEVVAVDVRVPLAAPASRQLLAGAFEWQVEAWCGNVSSAPATVAVAGRIERNRIVGESVPVFEGPPTRLVVLVGVLIAAAVMYPAIRMSVSASSPWLAIGAAAVVIMTAREVAIRRWHGEPFPFTISEPGVPSGGALPMELDEPADVSCTARLVTIVERVDSVGEHQTTERRLIDGPMSKIDPPTVRTIVAVPFGTPATSIVQLDADTEIRTRHFVEVDRFGSAQGSWRRVGVSRRSVEVWE